MLRGQINWLIRRPRKAQNNKYCSGYRGGQKLLKKAKNDTEEGEATTEQLRSPFFSEMASVAEEKQADDEARYQQRKARNNKYSRDYRGRKKLLQKAKQDAIDGEEPSWDEEPPLPKEVARKANGAQQAKKCWAEKKAKDADAALLSKKEAQKAKGAQRKKKSRAEIEATDAEEAEDASSSEEAAAPATTETLDSPLNREVAAALARKKAHEDEEKRGKCSTVFVSPRVCSCC